MEMKNKILLVLSSLVLVSCSYDDGYRVEGDKVVYERPWNTGHGTQIINVDADPLTFETLGGNNMKWARDKDHIFLRNHVLEYLDRNTFKVLNNDFGKDHKTVVCGIKPIPEVDVTTFKVKKLTNDSGRKVVLGIDKNAAYLPSCGSRRLSDSIDDLKPLKDNFYKDKTTVSWGSKFLTNVNVSTFKVLKNKYATDGDNVYYAYRKVTGADAKTFKVTGLITGKDKNYRYEMTNRVE